MTSPPFPPSPPSGPPRGTHASRRKETQPLPPSPALILIFASSRNMGGRGYPFRPQKQGRSGRCRVRYEDDAPDRARARLPGSRRPDREGRGLSRSRPEGEDGPLPADGGGAAEGVPR